VHRGTCGHGGGEGGGMRNNEETVVIGERILLVPYRHEYVEKYHEWMKDSYLQGE
jgi:hypothetical protein